MKPSAGELLTHPVVLVALAVWGLNDHLGKRAHPGWITGKASDVACLIVIPVLTAGVFELARRKATRTSRIVLCASAIVAALVMALINTWPPAAELYEIAMGASQWPFRWILTGASELRRVQLTMDPTDLSTIPAVLVPVALERRRWRSRIAIGECAEASRNVAPSTG
jgi:hypothetical protein